MLADLHTWLTTASAGLLDGYLYPFILQGMLLTIELALLSLLLAVGLGILGALARLSRFRLILGALPLVFALEEDMAEVGLDVFEFGGSVVRKTAGLAKRVGFFLPVPLDGFVGMLDVVFNTYCTLTRPGHSYTRFSRAETSHRSVRGVEREILGAALVGG